MDISAGMTVPVIFIITVLLAIPITTVRANVEVYGDDPSVLMAKSQAGTCQHIGGVTVFPKLHWHPYHARTIRSLSQILTCLSDTS